MEREKRERERENRRDKRFPNAQAPIVRSRFFLIIVTHRRQWRYLYLVIVIQWWYSGVLVLVVVCTSVSDTDDGSSLAHVNLCRTYTESSKDAVNFLFLRYPLQRTPAERPRSFFDYLEQVRKGKTRTLHAVLFFLFFLFTLVRNSRESCAEICRTLAGIIRNVEEERSQSNTKQLDVRLESSGTTTRRESFQLVNESQELLTTLRCFRPQTSTEYKRNGNFRQRWSPLDRDDDYEISLARTPIRFQFQKKKNLQIEQDAASKNRFFSTPGDGKRFMQMF